MQHPLGEQNESYAQVGADDGLQATVLASLRYQAEAGSQHQTRSDGIGIGDRSIADGFDKGKGKRSQPGCQGGDGSVDKNSYGRVHSAPPG